jgi:hypothetical protein
VAEGREAAEAVLVAVQDELEEGDGNWHLA